MHKELHRILMAAVGLWSFALHAQITITSLHVNSTLIGPFTLFQTTLQNSGPNSRFWLEGELNDSNGAPVLSFSTLPHDINTGVTSFTASDLKMRIFSYASTEAGRSAQQFQRLLGGRYEFCLRTKAQGEGDDELCETVVVDDYFTLDLVHPWNKDTIEETRPLLTWSLTSAGPPVSPSGMRLVLVPLAPKLSPAQAIASERPLFMVQDVRERAVPYPAGVADLVPGQCYAWQVERVEGRRVLDRSEPWGFCVRKEEVPVAMKYVQLEDIQPGSIYDAVDERIYFRYDEPYASTSLQCTIVSNVRTETAPHVVVDKGRNENLELSEPPKTIGLNLYELDLSARSLAPGLYTLLVKNEKGRSYPLHFRITK